MGTFTKHIIQEACKEVNTFFRKNYGKIDNIAQLLYNMVWNNRIPFPCFLVDIISYYKFEFKLFYRKKPEYLLETFV